LDNFEEEKNVVENDSKEKNDVVEDEDFEEKERCFEEDTLQKEDVVENNAEEVV
jgi:hypothetical protein